jgi:hypothetical protein
MVLLAAAVACDRASPSPTPEVGVAPRAVPPCIATASADLERFSLKLEQCLAGAPAAAVVTALEFRNARPAVDARVARGTLLALAARLQSTDLTATRAALGELVARQPLDFTATVVDQLWAVATPDGKRAFPIDADRPAFLARIWQAFVADRGGRDGSIATFVYHQAGELETQLAALIDRDVTAGRAPADATLALFAGIQQAAVDVWLDVWAAHSGPAVRPAIERAQLVRVARDSRATHESRSRRIPLVSRMLGDPSADRRAVALDSLRAFDSSERNADDIRAAMQALAHSSIETERTASLDFFINSGRVTAAELGWFTADPSEAVRTRAASYLTELRGGPDRRELVATLRGLPAVDAMTPLQLGTAMNVLERLGWAKPVEPPSHGSGECGLTVASQEMAKHDRELDLLAFGVAAGEAHRRVFGADDANREAADRALQAEQRQRIAAALAKHRS